MGKYEYQNAQNVLDKVEELIEAIDEQPNKRYFWRDVAKDLQFCDGWVDWIGVTRLKDMRKFLKEAIRLGYTGYVEFNPGWDCTTNGMWAFEGDREDSGYLYKSFNPVYEYWRLSTDDGEILPYTNHYNALDSIRKLEWFIVSNGLWLDSIV